MPKIENDNVRALIKMLEKTLAPMLEGNVFDIETPQTAIDQMKKFYTDAGYRVVNSDTDIADTGNIIVEGRIRIEVDGSAKLVPVETPL